MRSIFISAAILLTSLSLLVTACKKKPTDPTEDPANVSFDTKGMLTNLANNLIVPSYQAMSAAAGTLDSSVIAFNASPDATHLQILQDALKNAYKAWQACSEFQVGPADQQFLRENVNTFPADTNKINANTNSGSYNLAALSNFPAKGLPGIDYLLFGTGSDNNAIVARYTTDSKAANRKQYLAALSADLKASINAVLNGWTSGYKSTFINTTGTDVGSSLGQLINSADYDCEILKNDKIGIPLGKQSMGVLYPSKTEGYYCGISAQLAKLHLTALQNIYLGKSTQGGDGLGFDDYLVALKAQYNSGSLNTEITNRFAAAITDMGNVPDPLSNTIQTNSSVVNTAYVDIQKLVVLLKTDMPSAMGVLITYEDNDGD